jgi:hypothetical protein
LFAQKITIMKISSTVIGAAIAFLLSTACCWLPWLAIAIGGAAGLSAFYAGLENWSGWLMALGAGLAAWSGWQFWQKRTVQKTTGAILQSTLTCPNCGFQKIETMPTDACQFFYECQNCHALLKPKPGDCCVFCSFGSVKCPPIQTGHKCC